MIIENPGITSILLGKGIDYMPLTSDEAGDE
jgi:hypothetical protein